MNISYQAFPDYLTANEKEELMFYITNCSGEDLPFQNAGKLRAAQYPSFDDVMADSTNAPPGFYLYFFYGDGQSAMTSVDNSVNIEMSLKGECTQNWDIEKKDPSKKVGQYWVIAPKESITFQTGEQLSIEIKNLNVTDKMGQAPVMVMQVYDGENPYYNDVVVKYKAPELLSFGFVEKEYDINATVNLAWKLENDTGCRVVVDGERRYMDKISVAASLDYHSILIKGAFGEMITEEYRPPAIDLYEKVASNMTDTASPLFIQETDGFLSLKEASDSNSVPRVMPPYAAPEPPGPTPPTPKKNVTLKWKTHNTEKCFLENKYGTSLPTEGSATITINEYQNQVTLYAQAKDGCVIKQTIGV